MKPPMVTIGADVMSNGETCRAQDFAWRSKHPYLDNKGGLTEEQADELVRLSKGIMRYEDVPDIDNPEKHEWYEAPRMSKVRGPTLAEPGAVRCGKSWYAFADSKYGRMMVCLKTGIARTLTMGEFYQGTPVD